MKTIIIALLVLIPNISYALGIKETNKPPMQEPGSLNNDQLQKIFDSQKKLLITKCLNFADQKL